MRIQLSNEFHNTQITVDCVQIGRYYQLTARQASRVRRALCGMSDCSCSGYLGLRDRDVAEALRYHEAPHSVQDAAWAAAGKPDRDADPQEHAALERSWYVELVSDEDKRSW